MKRSASLVFFLLCIVLCMALHSAALADNYVQEFQSISAVIDGKDADRVHLRKEPSTRAASLGLYFTGTDVICETTPTEEWTKVLIGSQEGYIKSEYLRWGNDQYKVQSQQPKGSIQTSSWVNVRSNSSLEGEICGRAYNGDVVTIYGETVSHWYYAISDSYIGYIKADYVRLLNGNSGSNGSGTSSSAQVIVSPGQPENPQNVTQNLDPADSLEAYITAINCTINLLPTDNSVVTCQYDANALMLSHRVERGTHIITVESRSKIRTTATATFYVPRDTYYQIYLDVKNGNGSFAEGFDCYRIVYGESARFSLSLASGDRFGYTLGLINSECVVGISEIAQNYAIAIDQISNSTVHPAYDMPVYQAKASTYTYMKGNGEAQIKGSCQNSILEFTYVK